MPKIKYKKYADVDTSVESMALDAYQVSNIKQIPLAELEEFANDLEEGFTSLDNQQYSEGEQYEN
jgi:hypothetical protein|tara:strand:- start:341 stop:535 length:195 start_codon:yes stop_codon:yes gene_type:complete